MACDGLGPGEGLKPGLPAPGPSSPQATINRRQRRQYQVVLGRKQRLPPSRLLKIKDAVSNNLPASCPRRRVQAEAAAAFKRAASHGYFTLTGDKKYLSQLQKAIDWLKSPSIQLPANVATLNPLLAGRNVATFIELDTNEPLYIHRYGSNVHNGACFFDKDITNTVSHYASGRSVNTAALQKRLDEFNAMTPAQIDAMVAKSPLKLTTTRPLPKYFTAIREVDFPDLFEGAVMKTPVVPEAEAKTIVNALVEGKYWTAPVRAA